MVTSGPAWQWVYAAACLMQRGWPAHDRDWHKVRRQQEWAVDLMGVVQVHGPGHRRMTHQGVM